MTTIDWTSRLDVMGCLLTELSWAQRLMQMLADGERIDAHELSYWATRFGEVIDAGETVYDQESRRVSIAP